jgi:hypothetical protein
MGTPHEDRMFLAVMAQFAPEVNHADAVNFERLGETICAGLNEGSSIQEAITLMQQRNLAADVWRGVLAGATQGYCPHFEQALTAWLNSRSSSP